jgi:hypothetical protein
MSVTSIDGKKLSKASREDHEYLQTCINRLGMDQLNRVVRTIHLDLEKTIKNTPKGKTPFTKATMLLEKNTLAWDYLSIGLLKKTSFKKGTIEEEVILRGSGALTQYAIASHPSKWWVRFSKSERISKITNTEISIADYFMN